MHTSRDSTLNQNSVLALFAGQGTQSIGMGRELSEAATAGGEDLFHLADEVLGFGLRDICLKGPEDKLKQTSIAQPAILTVSVMAFRRAQKILGEQLQICAAAGHSLGEYSALVASGAMNFEDAIALVHKRGKYMQEASTKTPGKMIAVQSPEEEILQILKNERSRAEVASINTPKQTVIAGTVIVIDQFQSALRRRNIMHRELSVSGPFHCSLMRSAADKLRKDLNNITFQLPKFPVYSCKSTQEHKTDNPNSIIENLYQQVFTPVRWVKTLRRIIKDRTPKTAIEFGSSKTLSGLLRKIDSSIARHQVGKPEDISIIYDK